MGLRGQYKLSKVKLLYDLQLIDLEMDAKKAALAEITDRIGKSEALDEARAALAEEEEHLAELERGQRERESEADDLEAKAAVAEDKLYGGSVKNPKELASFQEQLKTYKAKIKDLDDKTLNIMEQIDTVEQGLATKREELAKMEQEWQAEQESLMREQSELSAVLSELEGKRNELASRVEPPILELYNTLRQKRQGKAIAKVEQGICQGCRIALPMSELQRVKTGQTIVQCGSCERILYLS
jgi:predicted  nucleic acid-binding Zn-ribbon protein